MKIWDSCFGTLLYVLKEENTRAIHGLELNICQTKFFSFHLKVYHRRNLTIKQRIKIIKTYYGNGDSAPAPRALRGDYGLQNRPTSQPIGKIVMKFE